MVFDRIHDVTYLDDCLERLDRISVPASVKAAYSHLYRQYESGETGVLDWSGISPLHKGDLKQATDWLDWDADLVSQVGILKLNGGLGTSMGCEGPKCLIPVMDETTFLDVSLAQVRAQRAAYQTEIPFIFMNSFKTEDETKQAIGDMSGVYHFRQNQFPRLRVSDRAPYLCPDDPKQEWAPPGHGDLYVSLAMSGLLDQLLADGIQYLFVSNIDNLGPQLDLGIVSHMVENDLSFVMEVTPKTRADVKGGTPVRYQDRLALLERAQVPADHIGEFEDLSTFPVFNTNNLWLHLPSIKAALAADKLHLPLIVNPKTIHGTEVIQFETAMGAALGCFDKSEVVVVSRDRFLPVKTTADLLVVQSDVIDKDLETGTFKFTEGCAAYPRVRLHSDFDSMSGYNALVETVPSLKSLSVFDHLEPNKRLF